MGLGYWYELVYKFFKCYLQSLQFNVIASFYMTLKIYN